MQTYLNAKARIFRDRGSCCQHEAKPERSRHRDVDGTHHLFQLHTDALN
ncbi:hypothetical protein [Alkalinema sp. FACHB-956]|nr:hypothetical protein [Alkalinema sp. FACHB-956]MBD2325691.1 hypothetical protein [Alkalinema sp. FACHB-956]